MTSASGVIRTAVRDYVLKRAAEARQSKAERGLA
jgi:hypothetical protein